MRSHSSAFRHLSASFAAIAVALTGPGCGAGVDSKTALKTVRSSTAPRPGDKAAKSGFISAADSICNRLNLAIADPPGTVLNDAKLAKLAPRHAVLEKKAVGELGRLVPPASMAPDWAKILAYRRTLAEQLAQLGAAAGAKDAAAIKKLAAAKGRVHHQLETLASHDGFHVCGTASSSTILPLSPPKHASRPKRT
jgi:hypothetical protein